MKRTPAIGNLHMPDQFPQRRERALHQLGQEDLQALLVTNESNVRYLTGFSGDSTYLILSAAKTIVVSDGRYTTQLADECPDLETHIRPPAIMLQDATAEVLGQMGVRSVGFDAGNLTVAQFQSLRDKTTTIDWQAELGRIEQMRAVKDNGELEQIRTAVKMAERAFAMFKAMLRGKDTEKEQADALEMYLRRAGADCSSFPPIVAAGPRAALPHAHPTEHRLDEEDVLLVDWGASAPSTYKSDLTRVLIRRTKSTSSGADEAEIRKVYDVVLQAQQQAVNTLRPGVTAGEVDAAARKIITDAGYGDNFSHSIGHGVGMNIHEAPLMKTGSEQRLQAGMVVTIEPGIYLPGRFGVRIEDDVLITDDGSVVLSNVPKTFDEQFVEY